MPNNNQYIKGFTLVEIVVVIGLLAIISASGAVVGLNVYNSVVFSKEKKLLHAVLSKARSQSINNVCLLGGCIIGAPHGVKIENDKYIIFEGDSFISSNPSIREEFASNSLVLKTGLDEVVFSPLSAMVLSSGTISLSYANKNESLTVNSEGGISD